MSRLASAPGSPPVGEDFVPVMDRTCTTFLAPELFEREGGVQRILQLYLRALCDLAGETGKVRLVVLNDGVMDSMQLRRSSNSRLTDWRVCNGDRRSFVRSAITLARTSSQLLCGHVGQAPVALFAKICNPRLRYYVVAHGIEVWRKLPALKRLAVRRATRVLCVSDYTRRELIKRSGTPEARTAVLPNALFPTFAITPGKPRDDGRPVILTVARLTRADRAKGVDHLLEALPAIQAARPGVTLRIIGRGDDLGRLIDLSRRLGIAQSVEFLGYLDDRHLSDEIASCSVFALPSKKEGFGLVFIEAMARGRPCVGVRAGGVPEVLTPDTGLLVEYGDVPALARACLTALERDWDETAILAQARTFSYPVFRGRLGRLLAPVAEEAR